MADLPAFTFPVVAWAPEPATGSPFDDGIREIRTPSDLTTIYFPQTDLRLGWTFVDAEGRCWEAVSSKVTGRADSWWARPLPKWIWHPRYRLAVVYVERPPISFGEVKSRLFTAVAANPQAYGYPYGPSRRQELRAAKNLRDLIRSDEERAIARLKPEGLLWQWLLWEGRCSRRTFLAAFAGLVVLWMCVSWIGLTDGPLVASVILSGAIALSALTRRLHDLRLSGWWLLLLGPCLLLLSIIQDLARQKGGLIVAGWLWWLPSLFTFGLIAIWPGTPGPNRYGYAMGKIERSGSEPAGT